LNFTDEVERLVAAHLRHDQVEDDQINSISILTYCINRLLAIFSDNYSITQSLQQCLPHLDNQLFVFNQKDGFRSLDKPCSDGNLSIYLFVCYRQIDVESCSLTNLAVYCDDACVVFDDSIC